MSSINEICQQTVANVPDALACGVVDINTGQMMGVHHTISYFTQSYLDAVAAAAVDMFRGKTVRRVEELISRHRGEKIKDSFEEIFISSTKVFHFMKMIPGKNAVVVMVTRKTSPQGLGWAMLRESEEDLRRAI